MRERTRLEIEHARLAVGGGSGVLREFEVIEPGDTRHRVKDSFSIPFRFICHLEISYRDTREKGGGSGTLIGRRYVLTAAHNLLTRDNLTARRVLVSPARNGSENSIGPIEGVKWEVHKDWRRTNWARDYALIKLKKEVALDNFVETDWKPLGCWGDPKNGAGTSLAPLGAADVDGRRAFVAGYPGGRDQQNYEMLGAMGIITGIAPNRPVDPGDVFLHHTVDTAPGESGSPLWVRDDRTNVRSLVGIHIHGGRVVNGKFVTNVAVRITPQVIAQIDTWMKTM